MRSTSRRSLGHLEAEVMEQLWRRTAAASVRDVLDDLSASRDRPLAYTTVLTVLDNLHGKAMVTRDRVGRAFRYAPTRSRDEHTADMLRGVLDERAASGAAMLHFVSDLRPDEVAALRAALDQVDGEPR